MTLAELKRRLTGGKVFTCIENTYRPELNGQRRIVTKPGTTRFMWDSEDGKYRRNRTDLPKARDIVASTDDSITWRMFKDTDDTITLQVTA